jgi:hypothetical protein
MLINCLLKLVFRDKTDKLSSKIGELNSIFTLFIFAHEFKQPVFHEIDSHSLQISPNRNILAFTCQASLQLHSDVFHDRAVCL